MRVKISYGIALEEVPEEANRLIDKALKQLHASVKILEHASLALEDCDDDFSTSISYLDKARKTITDVDSVLLDSQSILQGLENYYNGEQNVSEGRPIMDSSGNTAEEV